MNQHPAMAAGRVAVITGAASGIGLAAAKRFSTMGMRVCLVDTKAEALEKAAADVGNSETVMTMPTDVSDPAAVLDLRDAVYSRFGEVAVLMNNAGTAPGGGAWENPDAWRRVLNVNLFGVVNGVQAFTPRMLAQGTPCAIVNTGSKQGITCPPGDTAYNVSKAGVKVLTEGLAHSLRNTPDCRITAHLLVPGSTFTGMTRASEKPPGAWLPDQVIDFMLAGMATGDFYLICPDNDVTREIDNKRMAWAIGDIINNRPPLSRWHPDYKDAFAAFLAEDG